MQAILRSPFGGFFAGGHSGPLSVERMAMRLRLGLGAFIAALCVAFLQAGAPWQAVAFGGLVIGSMAFGAGLVSRFRDRLRFSPQASTALMLVAAMTLGCIGCTPGQRQQVKVVVGQIATEIPKAITFVQGVTGLAEIVLPAEAPLVDVFSSTVQASLVQIAALCDAYAKAPTDDIWQSILAAVNNLVGAGSAALLDAAHITNPISRGIAQAAIGALQSVLLVIDGYVQSSQTAAQNKALAQARVIKLEQIKPFLDRQVIEAATGYSFDQVYAYETSLGF